MNRVRQFGNKYQVLIPLIYNKGTYYNDILLNDTLDSTFSNNGLKEFPTLSSAQEEAYLYSDINWNNLIIDHIEIFKNLKLIIEKILNYNNIIADIKCNFVTSEKLKNSYFNKIIIYKNYGQLANEMISIINFDIINPWSSKLVYIADFLKKEKQLKIINELYSNNIIYLFCITDLGTPYKIRLIPSIIENFLHFLEKNDNEPQITMDPIVRVYVDPNLKKIFEKLTNVQRVIDMNSI